MFQTVNEKLLGYDLFIQQIKEKIQAVMGDKYEVMVQKVVKNNSLELDTLIVLKKGRNIAPNIYLEAYYDSYLQGTKIEEIVERLRLIYSHCAIPVISDDFTLNLEDVREYIIFRIVNYDKNEKILQEIPHKKIMDLAVTYHCLVKNNDEVIGTIRLSNDHTKDWGISAEDLDNLAYDNTVRLFPATIQDMDEVIRNYISEMELPEEIIDNICKQDLQPEVKMFVLTNRNGVNGASCILYKNVLKNFADEINSDLVIIPSSIHEIILLPFCGRIEREELNDMVGEVNANQVPIDEVLSEHVYFYLRDRDRIVM